MNEPIMVEVSVDMPELKSKIQEYLEKHVRNDGSLPYWSLALGIQGVIECHCLSKGVVLK